jgi:hypothetical protein
MGDDSRLDRLRRPGTELLGGSILRKYIGPGSESIEVDRGGRSLPGGLRSLIK